MDPAVSTSPQKLSTYAPPSDPSKYIRTFAKDMAAMGGGMAPVSVPQSQVLPATSAPAPQIPVEDVSLPAFDPSPVQRNEASSPKEFPQEQVVLSPSDSDDVFITQRTSSPAPVPVAQEPVPQHTFEQAPRAMPDTPMPDLESREDILARLRASVAATSPVPPPAPEIPARPIPEPMPLPEVPPADFSSFNLQPSQKSIQAQIPAAPQVPGLDRSVPSPLHTYSSDFSDHIDSQQSSTFSVLAAQSDAGRTAAAPRRRSYAPVITGLLMLIVGIGAVVGAVIYTRSGIPMLSTPQTPSVIAYDESVQVQGTGAELMRAIADVAQGRSIEGNVIVTYLSSAAQADGSMGSAQTGGTLIRALQLPAPSILLRNIQDGSTVGVVNAGGESRPFMILSVSSYERTFAGMLAWEDDMAENLYDFYPPYQGALQQPGSGAGADDPILLQNGSGAGTFTDAVVANYDVRILRDELGRSLLIYGYKSRDTLIIARDEAAFTLLASRLSAQGD